MPAKDGGPRSASWVVRHLTLTYPQAYNIVSFDKLDYCSSLNNTRALNDKRNFTFYHGDVTDPAEVLGCMERHGIDTVLHFAAQSHVDLSFGNSYSFTHANVYGTHVLLESAKKARIERFIHVSTDEVYGEVKEGEGEVLESSILAPTNPYAASKAAAEMLVQSYQKSFKLPTIIVRSNNVYGPHQYPESMCCAHVSARAPVLTWGQKSFPSLPVCSTGAGPLSSTATESRHGVTSTPGMRRTPLTRFSTRGWPGTFTTLGLPLKCPI